MARENAYMILNQYFEDESFLNIALNEQLKKSNLKREDKDLCTTIVYGTIQNLLYIQYQLQPYIKGKRVKKKIRTLLYMSLYQLIYLDKIPEEQLIKIFKGFDKNICSIEEFYKKRKKIIRGIR